MQNQSGQPGLLMDSALKGTKLLALAAFAAFMLRRDSAATRQLFFD